MNEIKATEILKEYINKHNDLDCPPRIDWMHNVAPDLATLHGDFTVDELKAIAWWIQEHHE